MVKLFVVVGAKVWTVIGPFEVPPDPSGGRHDNRGFGAFQHGGKISSVVFLFCFYFAETKHESARISTGKPE